LTKDDRIFYYFGQFYAEGNDKGKPATDLIETNFSQDGLHAMLLKANDWTIKEKKRVTEEGVAKKLADSTITQNVNKVLTQIQKQLLFLLKQMIKLLIETLLIC
jgi:hypothetical protein